MPKLEDKSCVELLMQKGVDQGTAWAMVKARIEQEKAEKEPSTPAEKKEYIVLIDDPKCKLPDDMTCFVAQMAKTPYDENGNLTDVPRTWGIQEVHNLLEIGRRNAMEHVKKYSGTGGLSELVACAGKVLKETGIEIKTKVAVYAAPIALGSAAIPQGHSAPDDDEAEL